MISARCSWKVSLLALLATIGIATTSAAQRRQASETGGSGEPEWKSWGTSLRPQIPEDAVSSAGVPALFVCRSFMGQALVPGQLASGQCQVALNQQVVASDTFEVLVGDRSISWVPYAGPAGNVPASVLRGGREGQGEFIVCRARSSSGAVLGLGHAVDDARRCLFVASGKPMLSDYFDFLVKGSARGQQADGRTFERAGAGRQCDLSQASLNIRELWPADGQMSRQPIFIKGIPNPTVTKVEQDECAYGIGAVDDAPDAAIGPGGKSVVVRSQRMEPNRGGDGRVYTIHFSAPGCGDSMLTVCVPTAPGVACQDSGVRYDSTSRATTGIPACDPKCHDAEPSITKLTPNLGEWVKIELTRITGYTITGVIQDECRDGVATARISGRRVELRNKFNGDGDGRVYTIFFRCASGELGSVKVKVPKTGVPDAIDSDGGFDATIPEVDAQCCAPKLDRLELVYIPGQSDLTSVTLQTTAESRITKVTQDECVDAEFDAKLVTSNTVQVRNERTDGGDGRVYTFHYQCGGKEHRVTCAVPIDSRTKAVDSGQKYASTTTSIGEDCDTTPPTNVACVFMRADGATMPAGVGHCLWPPNHAEVRLGVIASATDDVTPSSDLVLKIVAITSDEATSTDTGSGGPNKYPDAAILSANSAWFRAERSGSGDGRVYQVRVSATDRAGNEGFGTCQVKVSHDQGSPDCSNVVDSGQKFDATAQN